MKRELLIATLAATASESNPLVRELVFYAGANVPRFDFWKGEHYMLRFSMDPGDINLGRLKSGAPLLNSHSSQDVADALGVVEDAWVENGVGKARVRFSGRDSVADIVRDVNDGILRNLSMGVDPGQIEDVTPKGSKMKHYLARGWEPQEISIVPIGADAGAQFLSGAAEYQVMREMMARAEQLSSEAGAASRADQRARFLLNIERERFAHSL